MAQLESGDKLTVLYSHNLRAGEVERERQARRETGPGEIETGR